MGNTRITDFLIYRWRYWIGYITVAVLFVALLLFTGLYVPGGLGEKEVETVVKTAEIKMADPASLAVTNLPYSLLQKASFELLGVTNFSIKLPSLIFALVTGIGLVLLLRRWFRPNIAVLATIIMITTGQFLFVAQYGTPSITYIAWSVWLLLSAAMITSDVTRKIYWKFLFVIVAAASLYTPLSLYLLLAIVSAAILHPHLRYVIKKQPLLQSAVFGVLWLVLIAPLIYGLAINPQLRIDLLGIPQVWPPDLLANFKQLFSQYLNFLSPSSGALMAPILGLGSVALIGLGIWQLYKTRYTARSYTINAWTLLLVPVLLISPGYTSITFVPFLLLLASGLDYLLRYWYRMFPRNPYARIVGMIPLVILVGGLVVTGVARYVYGYHYDPQTAQTFSRDLTLFNHQVRGEYATTILVTDKEKPFYDAVAKYTTNKFYLLARTDTVRVLTAPPPMDGGFAATRDAHLQVQNRTVTNIVTTSHSSDADRFYIYK